MRSAVQELNLSQLEELVYQLSNQSKLTETREILLETKAIALRLHHLLEQEKNRETQVRIAAALAALAIVTSTFQSKVEVTSSPTLSVPAIERVIPTTGSTIESAAKELFKSADSIGSRAIGHAEGNYTVSGKKTKLYFGHVDPGNLSWGERVTNRGFCSDQGRGADVNSADVGCVKRILSRLDTLANDFRAAGIPNPTVEEFINAADLWNQASPQMSRNFPHRLAELKAKGKTGTDMIADARTASFYVKGKNTATGLLGICRRENRGLSDWDCVLGDQLRRAKAIASVLKHENIPLSSPLVQQQEQQETAQPSKPGFQFPHFNLFGNDAQRAPSIAPSEQDILVSKVIKYMEAQNYEIARHPKEINLIYIRNNKRATNRWTDKLLIIKFVNNKPKVVGAWNATTMPGEHYIKYGRKDGAAFIVPGQYKAWQVGRHISYAEAARGGAGHEALVQRGGAVKILRDFDKDGIGENPVEGMFGINLHGTRNQSEFVGQSSAGCLVVGGEGIGMRGVQEMMRIVKSDRRYLSDKQFVFSATIIENWRL